MSESRFVGLVTLGLCDVTLGFVHLHPGGRGVGRSAREDDQPAIETVRNLMAHGDAWEGK